MLRLGGVAAHEVARAMVRGRFRLQIGRITLRIDSNLPELEPSMRRLYAHYPCSVTGGEFDFDVAVAPPSLLRRWFRRNASFRLSGDEPFLPMPPDHAHALFEWGANWTIGAHSHRYLILHSAVLEHRGRGVLLAATSGSGKSTLAAELTLSGWRLLSDELALIDGPELFLVPHPRPISLKNQSIDVIRTRYPDAEFGPAAQDTHKGTIVHLRVPDASVDRSCDPVPPALIVFPKWSPGAPLRVDRIGPGEAAMRLIDQSFNYPILGRVGFERLASVVAAAPAWEVEYSSLDEIVPALDGVLVRHV